MNLRLGLVALSIFFGITNMAFAKEICTTKMVGMLESTSCHDDGSAQRDYEKQQREMVERMKENERQNQTLREQTKREMARKNDCPPGPGSCAGRAK